MGNRSTKVHNIPHLESKPTETAVIYDREQATQLEILKGLDYDVNALVLEGGGAKAAGQIGALQVIDCIYQQSYYHYTQCTHRNK